MYAKTNLCKLTTPLIRPSELATETAADPIYVGSSQNSRDSQDNAIFQGQGPLGQRPSLQSETWTEDRYGRTGA